MGAPYEGGPVERLVWKLIGKTPDGCLRWTDDTQMTLDLADSLLQENEVNPDAIAKRFATSYRWSRGYGPGAAKVLKRIRLGEDWQRASTAVYRDGSYGNGAAMRAPILALYCGENTEALIGAAKLTANITHAHPLGIEGAVMIALASQAFMQGCQNLEIIEVIRRYCHLPELTKKLDLLHTWIATNAAPTCSDVAKKLGNGITAATSCPTALYLALRFRQAAFEDMLTFIIACRGDVDTIAAMAVALWGIDNGDEPLPSIKLESRERIMNIAEKLFERSR